MQMKMKFRFEKKCHQTTKLRRYDEKFLAMRHVPVEEKSGLINKKNPIGQQRLCPIGMRSL